MNEFNPIITDAANYYQRSRAENTQIFGLGEIGGTEHGDIEKNALCQLMAACKTPAFISALKDELMVTAANQKITITVPGVADMQPGHAPLSFAQTEGRKGSAPANDPLARNPRDRDTLV